MNVRKRVLSLLLSVVLVMQMFGIEALAANSSAVMASGECGMQGDNLRWELSYDGVLTISGTGKMADYDIQEYGDCTTAPWSEYEVYIPELVIEEGVTSIGSWAFGNFWSLQKVSIASTVTEISECAFTVVGNEGNCMVRFFGTVPEFKCKTCESEYCEGCLLNGCEDCGMQCAFTGGHLYFFYPNTDTAWSELAEEFCDINWHAVGNDGILVSGTCGESLTWNINENGKLTISGSGEIPNNPKWRDYFVLISEVSPLPEGVTSIGQGAFAYLPFSEKLVIPQSVTSIGNYAFRECGGGRKDLFFRGCTCDC